MNTDVLIPYPDALPVPWGWFKVLLLAGFGLHILFMNVMLGSALMACFTRVFSPAVAPAASWRRDFSRVLPYVIAFTVNLGVVPLLFLQVLYGHLYYTAIQLMAVYWLSAIFLLIAAYYGAYRYKHRFGSDQKKPDALLFFITGTFLAVAFFFVNNMTFMVQPELFSLHLQNPNGGWLNLSDPSLWPRYLHFVTASIAAAGLFRALWYSRRFGRNKPFAENQVRAGLQWFTHATLLQVFLGIWFLISLPGDVAAPFAGGDPFRTGLLAAALVGSLAAVWFAVQKNVKRTTGYFVFVFIDMVVLRDLVRDQYLSPYFHPSVPAVTGEWSPFIVFLLAAAGGIVSGIYMARLSKKQKTV